MPWPTPQEYNEALQHPKLSFNDRVLKLGQPELNALGLPRPTSGAFCNVYCLHTAAKDWAVRCFLNDFPDQKIRYQEIARFTMTDDLPYTVSFEYLPMGIKVGSFWYPILKMEWVHGLSFLEFVQQNIDKPAVLLNLSDDFYRMMLDLHEAGIAHGDLQHGNIIITDTNELRFVDYDGMYVPSLAGNKSNELGHRNYQHPGRNNGDFGPYLDNFSAWVIYLSLEVVARDSRLWYEIHKGDECLLFKQSDFLDADCSPVFQTMLDHKDPDIVASALFIRRLLDMQPRSIPPLVLSEETIKFGNAHVPTAIERLSWRINRWWHHMPDPGEWLSTHFAIRNGHHSKPQVNGVSPAPHTTKHKHLPEWLEFWNNLGIAHPASAPAAVPSGPSAAAALSANQQNVPSSAGHNTSRATAAQSADRSPLPANKRTQTRNRRVRELLSQAAWLAAQGAFLDADKLCDTADQECHGRPKLVHEILRARASIWAMYGDSYVVKHNRQEAARCYVQSALYLLEDKSDDFMFFRVVIALADCLIAEGKYLEAKHWLSKVAPGFNNYAKRQLDQRISRVEHALSGQS